MPNANHIQTNFTAGELSPKLEGRVDIDKYPNSAKRIENFIVMPHGGLRRRGGTRHIAAVKNNIAFTAPRLLPFQFSTAQTYVLEFGHLYIRFYKDKARLYDVTAAITNITQANPAGVTATAHGFSTGNRVFIDNVLSMNNINGREFTITVTGPDNFTLNGVNSSGFTAYTSGGSAKRPYEIASPYSADPASSLYLWKVQYTQSADVMYLVHPKLAPRILARTGHTAWTLTTPTFEWGPFKARKPDAALMVKASDVTGANITITANNPVFTALHVGTQILLEETTDTLQAQVWKSATAYAVNAYVQNAGSVYRCTLAGTSTVTPPVHKTGAVSDGTVTWAYAHSGRGYALLTGYTSPTQMAADVVSELPISALGYTQYWAIGSWSEESGYPSTVAFYEERILFAATPDQPQTVWGSKTGDFANFLLGALADDAIEYTIASDQVNAIQWINPGRNLVIGTTGGEFIMSGGAAAITPANIVILRQSTYGSSAIPAHRIANMLVYVQRAGRKLRQMTYDYVTDSFTSPDLTLLSDHITIGGVVGISYQQEEDSTIWVALSNGHLVGCTYMPEQQVVAWHRHILGGTSDAGGTHPLVKSIATVPSVLMDHDDFWLIVKRRINGADVTHVEFLEEGLEAQDAQSVSFYIDAGLSYSGAPATVMRGLDHLEGESVSILADGAATPASVVLNGSVTLSAAASVVHIGLGYTSKVQTQRIEAGSADGTSQGKIKRINRVTARLWRSLDMKVGSDESDLDTISFRTSLDPMGSPVPLFSGDVEIAMPSGYDKDGHVMIVQDQPLPLTVLAIICKLRTNG